MGCKGPWLRIVVSRNVCGRICLFACWTPSSGETMVSFVFYFFPRCKIQCGFSDRQETQQLGFTYVQGMNVLAAPFLYTMPSELEAFYCFSNFIEQSCPLYVQPTLEGVHRGLKVSHSLHIVIFIIERCTASRSMFENRRSGAVRVPPLQESLCRDLCIPLFVPQFLVYSVSHIVLLSSRPHTLCVYTPT